jgi:hypothetical protein
MHDYQSAIFVFDSLEPTSVTVYPDLEWARGSLESLDVGGDGGEPAFTVTGQIIRIEPSADLFARFEVTQQVDLKRLQALLRQVKGPAELADDPSAYAREWTRVEELDAQRPPFLPERVWSWYRRRSSNRSSPSYWRTL